MSEQIPAPTTAAFKAETRQLLNILIHSLYSEREVFLREFNIQCQRCFDPDEL